MDHKELYSGFIRLHIMHQASKKPVFGIGITEELARRGYRLSAGTLYPLLHGLEKNGLLQSHYEPIGRSKRRLYRATPTGKRAVAKAKKEMRKFFDELFNNDD